MRALTVPMQSHLVLAPADLEVQARMHAAAARAPWNAWLWRAPQVVFYSTRAPWAPDVAARLRQQGVLVAGAPRPAFGAPSCLPHN